MNYTTIEWQSSALIVIDVQNDFVDGAMPVAGTAEALPKLVELVQAFRDADRPIAHVIRLYEPRSSDVDLPRRRDIENGIDIVAPGTPGALIPAALTQDREIQLDDVHLLSGEPQQLAPNEAVFYKPRWSAFYRTPLLEWLASRNISSVVVAGCNLPNCPRATLFDASERDLRAALVTDATSQVTESRIDDLRLIGVETYTTSDVRRALTSR